MFLTQVMSNPGGRGRVVTGEILRRSKVSTTTEGGKANLTWRTFVSGTSDASLVTNRPQLYDGNPHRGQIIQGIAPEWERT